MKKLIPLLAVALSFTLTVSLFSSSGQPLNTVAAVITNSDTARAEAVSFSKTDITKTVSPTSEVTEHASKSAKAQASSTENEAIGKGAVTITEKNLGSLSAANSGFSETDSKQIVAVSDSLGYVNNELLLFFAQGTYISKRLEIVRGIGGVIIGFEPLTGAYQVRIAEKDIDEITALCEALMEYDEVDVASANVAIKYSETAVPNDPWQGAHDWDEHFPSGTNWWAETIYAPSAWDYNSRFSTIKIGIVDSGFDTSHEDLQGLISFPNSLAARQNRATDHGTHVSGIIAANDNNGIGITGICWNAELICQDWEPAALQYWYTETKILSGFTNVVKSGAKVVNLSIGASSSYASYLDFFWSLAMRFESMIYSYSMSKLLSQGYDFVVVQSAGNGDMNGNACDITKNGLFCSITEDTTFLVSGVSYQDIADRIIIVGSVYRAYGARYIQSRFSNYGDVDICAPGEDIFSCTCNGAFGENYVYMSGTSMAAPMVTGVAALVWSVNDSFTGAQVKEIVCSRENTCYDAEPSSLQADTYRVVNAQLAVEEAVRLTDAV